VLLRHLTDALDGAVELVPLPRRHHHPSADRIQRVCHEVREDGDGVADQEVEEDVMDY
jgi:hypothetical protein